MWMSSHSTNVWMPPRLTVSSRHSFTNLNSCRSSGSICASHVTIQAFILLFLLALKHPGDASSGRNEGAQVMLKRVRLTSVPPNRVQGVDETSIEELRLL